MAQRELRAVRRAAERIERFERELRSAIYLAVESGESYRDIAPYAGRNHSRVGELYHEEKRRRETEAERD